MTQFCERCGATISDKAKANTDGDILCELCWDEDTNSNSRSDFESSFESASSLVDEDDFGYDPYRGSYNDDENDLYEDLIDQERNFY